MVVHKNNWEGPETPDLEKQKVEAQASSHCGQLCMKTICEALAIRPAGGSRVWVGPSTSLHEWKDGPSRGAEEDTVSLQKGL